MTAQHIILLWYFELEHIKITWLKIKAKKKTAYIFFKAAQILSTRPMRYSPVQADQKKPNLATLVLPVRSPGAMGGQWGGGGLARPVGH